MKRNLCKCGCKNYALLGNQFIHGHNVKGKKKSKKHRKSLSDAFKGKNNPMYGIHLKISSEHKEKISKANSGKNNPMYGKSSPSNGSGINGKLWSIKNKNYIKYDSSWEKHFIKLMDKLPTIEYFSRVPFRINYKFNGDKTYNPDFLVKYNFDIKETLIEIKPKFRIKEYHNRSKHRAIKKFAEENDYNYARWTEQELGLV